MYTSILEMIQPPRTDQMLVPEEGQHYDKHPTKHIPK
jgi:hypothetical protein